MSNKKLSLGIKNSRDNQGDTTPLISIEQQTEITARATITKNEFGNLTIIEDITVISPIVIDKSQITPTSLNISAAMGKLPDEDDATDIVEVDITGEDEVKVENASIWRRLKGIVAIFLATSMLALNYQILYYAFNERRIPYSKSLFLATSYLVYSIINYVPLQYAMFKDMTAFLLPFRMEKKLVYFLLTRGLLGSLIQFVTSHAIDRFHSPAPPSVIAAMAPIFVYINAYFVLKEKLGVVPILNVFVAIGGVLVMNINEMRHPTNSDTPEGTGLALTAMYMLAWVTVLIRFLREVNPFLINMAFGLGGVLVQGTLVLIENPKHYIDDQLVIGLCVASGLASCLGNYLMNMSLKYESAGVVSLIRTTEVIFSFLFQFWFFGLRPNMLTALGAGMILFGVVCVTMRKIVGESSETSQLRKYLWFLLY